MNVGVVGFQSPVHRIASGGDCRLEVQGHFSERPILCTSGKERQGRQEKAGEVQRSFQTALRKIHLVEAKRRGTADPNLP